MDIDKVKGFLKEYPEQPVLLVGPPGIGKTQVVNEFAKEIGRKLYTVVLSHLDVDDLKGIPFVNDKGELSIKRGPLIPDKDEKAVVFIDEITTANPVKLAIALKMIDERKVGYFEFPNSYVIAAGNPPEWKGKVLDERILSRCVVINVETSVESFVNYLMDRYKNSTAAEMVSAFLSFDKSMLLKQPSEAEPFPTPRGYEKIVSRYTGRDLVSLIKKDETVQEVIMGCIGKAPGVQFMNYLKVYNQLPDIDAILEGKLVKANKITELNVKYAVSMALAFRVKSNEQVARAWEFIKTNVSGRDFLVLVAKILLKKGFQLGPLIRDIGVEELLGA